MNAGAWHSALLSDTTETYVCPFPPQLGEEMEIALLVASGAPLCGATLRTIENGIDHHYPMVQQGTQGGWLRFTARLRLTQPQLHYHFTVKDCAGGIRYFTRSGVTSVYPDESTDFHLDTADDVPDWVSRSVFYQIFPDRFSSGNPSLGVRDHEISRDGFHSRAMNWNSLPLPYPEGGSLDFFNGDLPGIEQRLDYLQALGVNALYLNPIFTAKTNHRYDCLDYFRVDDHLGGDKALIALCQACHAREVRLILDVSINHIAIEHPWAQGIAAKDRRSNVVAKGADGSPVNWMGVQELLKLDYKVERLRDRIYRDPDSLVQRYLKPPFSIDGWRFDVASETGNHEGAQLGFQLWREIRNVVKGISPRAYIVGEHWHDSSHYLRGDQWDSAMNYFGAGRPVRMWLGEEDRFAVAPQREGVKGRPISGHELASLILQHWNTLAGKLVHVQFNLFDSHDVARLHLDPFVDFPSYSGAVALLFILPGTPSIYYGDEVGIGGNFEGDHGKRYPMPWESDQQESRYRSLYSELAHLKRTARPLHVGSLRILHAGEDELVVARILPEESVLLVLNRGPVRTITVEKGPAAGRNATRLPLLGFTEGSLNSDDHSFSVALESHRSVIIRISN